MPCSDGGPSWGSEKETRNGLTIDQLEAALCGIFTVLEARGDGMDIDPWLSLIDWKEAGVSRKSVEAWRKRHKKEDEARRAREAAAKRKDELRKIAIGKLSPDELEVLGIKW